MGIYLFGELMISQNGRLWKIAHEVFDEIRDEMDRCTYETVLKIIFGEDDTDVDDDVKDSTDDNTPK